MFIQYRKKNVSIEQTGKEESFAVSAYPIEALANSSDCKHCSERALRRRNYQHRFSSRLCYALVSSCAAFGHTLWRRVQTTLFPSPDVSPHMRVCVSLPAFPFTGGVLTVLEGVTQVTQGIWEQEYLTQLIGPDLKEYTIHRCGTNKFSPWHFPLVWLHSLAGAWKLVSLMRRGAGYHVFLPQDATFTAAAAALAAKITGTRVVCIDHAHISLLDKSVYSVYRAERLREFYEKKWHWSLRLLVRLLFHLYGPSLFLLARLSASQVDHYLVPGVVGDGVEDICKRLGIPPSRITRFESMIDIDRHVVVDSLTRVRMREQRSIRADAIVIAIVCRLSPEKGIHIALKSISQALDALSPELRDSVSVVIAGDGPIRQEVEEDIHTLGLDQTCVLWGDISRAEVTSLLSMSDIFLYTSTRGACFAMAVLEAMASGCAVVASTEPISNAHLLADGRGIAVPANAIEQTAQALTQLISDLPLCSRMGQLAREHIAVHHSPAKFRQTLLRATAWSAISAHMNNEV